MKHSLFIGLFNKMEFQKGKDRVLTLIDGLCHASYSLLGKIPEHCLLCYDLVRNQGASILRFFEVLCPWR